MMSMIVAIILLVLIVAFTVMAGREIGRQKNPISAIAVGGAILVFLSVLIMVSLHCLKIPVTTGILLAIFSIVIVILAIVHILTCRKLLFEITPDVTRLLLPGFALFAVIILPYTHFTGIDTYKWQDLATAIDVEQNIPWLVHPLSLLGFTPRSYPSAQPILLATFQISGGLGIDAGFAVLSLFMAALGCASAYLFGLRAFVKSQTAAIYALLYIFTPVFTRYVHWGTGRGLFLVIFPLVLATIVGKQPLEDSSLSSRVIGRLLSPLTVLLLLLLLALSHKVGFIIALVYIPIYLSGFIVPKKSNRLVVAISVLPFIALALLVVPRTMLPFPAGNAVGIVRFSLTRFGFLMPLVFLGLLAPSNLLSTIKWRRLYLFVLVAIPLTFERHMYGALIAAPLITLAATEGIVWLKSDSCSVFCVKSDKGENVGRSKPFFICSILFCVITVVFTISTVIHRSLIATPGPVYNAAQFLEKHDPMGPFVINAPGRARTQIQAYVSGCPRFNIISGTNSVISISHPPSIKGAPREVLQNWTSYMRGFMTVPETATDWYGKDPRQYYIRVNEQGFHPAEAKEIYNKDGVQIYTRQQ